MNRCELPATGTGADLLVWIALLALVVGLVLVVASRSRPRGIVLTLLIVVVGSTAVGATANAAAECPPTTSSTATTTTAGFVRAEPADDTFIVEVGQTVRGNILANDFLGNPPAVLTHFQDETTHVPDQSGVIRLTLLQPIDSDTGGDAYLHIASATVLADGSVTITGVAEGDVQTIYVLDQGEFDEDDEVINQPAALLRVRVISPSDETSTSEATTTTGEG